MADRALQGRRSPLSSSSWTRRTMEAISRPAATNPSTTPTSVSQGVVWNFPSANLPRKNPTRGDAMSRVGIARRSPAERKSGRSESGLRVGVTVRATGENFHKVRINPRLYNGSDEDRRKLMKLHIGVKAETFVSRPARDGGRPSRSAIGAREPPRGPRTGTPMPCHRHCPGPPATLPSRSARAGRGTLGGWSPPFVADSSRRGPKGRASPLQCRCPSARRPLSHPKRPAGAF